MTHETDTAPSRGSPALDPRRSDESTVDTPSQGRLRRALPNLLILAAMSGIAFIGHRTDWRFGWASQRMPGPSAQQAFQVTVDNEPVSVNSDAAEWCSDHGVAHCPLCFPQWVQLDTVPAVDANQLNRIRAALSQLGRAENSPTCALVHHCLRFDAADAAEKLGIEVAPAWTTEMSEVIAASGETAFDPTRVAHLSSRMPGSAWRVMKRLGQPVQEGEVLALIESGDVGKAKADLQQALVQLQLRRQANENIRQAPVAEQQRNEAVAALRDAEARALSAEQALVNVGLRVSASELLDLPFDAIAKKLQRLGLPGDFADLQDEDLPGTLVPIIAPQDGVITQSDLIAGDVVEPSRRLFTIADPGRLVLTLYVSPGDAAQVKIGQVVHFRPDGAMRETTTRVSWIAAAARDRTRTVPVRAELDNSEGRLLASSFGLGRIVLRREPDAVVVPNEAVRSDGDCRLIFVRDKNFLKPAGPKVFHVRTVRTGARDAKYTEIIVGVVPGEVVATKGSDILLNELRRHHNTQTVAGKQNQKQRVQTSRRTGVDHALTPQ